MKFKTKQELIDESVDFTDRKGDSFDKERLRYYKMAIDDAFKSFVERVKFYDSYVDNEELLCKEQTEIWRDNWMCTIEGVNAGEYSKEENIRNYNNWVFKLCFGEMMK